MALSPWYVAPTLSLDELAALLSDVPVEEVLADGLSGKSLKVLAVWKERIIAAVKDDRLKASRQEHYINKFRPNAAQNAGGELMALSEMMNLPETAEFISLSQGEWVWVKVADDLEGYPGDLFDKEKVVLELHKLEIDRWLRASGVADDDIPEALRVIPKSQLAVEQALDQPKEGEELRALEALGLLAETFAIKGPSNCRKLETGKPNKAQIAEAMSTQAGEVYGMSKSKLQRLLTESLDAWDEKRR